MAPMPTDTPIPDKAVEAALDAWWQEVHHPERHDMRVRLRAVLTAAYAADPSRAAAEEVVRAARDNMCALCVDACAESLYRNGDVLMAGRVKSQCPRGRLAIALANYDRACSDG